MYGWCWETLKENFETMYTQAFIIDSIITKTEDWFEDHNISNDYDPRMGNKYHCTFHIGSETYNWSIDMWNKNSLTNPGVSISIDQLGMLDSNKPHSQPVLRYHFGFPYLKETQSPELHVDDDIFKEYKEIIDNVFEDKKHIEELFNIRTNPGMPTTSTYVVDDILNKFNMELSWMKSAKYVSERISFDDFLKMDIDDLNYNNTIYRLADRSCGVMEKLNEHLKNKSMLSHLYRMENVRLNGLFYVENCDLQDVSEAGYDTIDILCSSVNDTKPYKIVEIYLNTEVK